MGLHMQAGTTVIPTFVKKKKTGESYEKRGKFL